MHLSEFAKVQERWKQKLQKRLQIAGMCSVENQKKVEDLFLEHSNVFALDDSELRDKSSI